MQSVQQVGDFAPYCNRSYSAPDDPRLLELKPTRTSPYLSQYEFARIVGMIALQLGEDTDNGDDALEGMSASPIDRAWTDVLLKRVPVVIRRYLPDGSVEDCSLAALKLDLVHMAPRCG